MSFHRRRYSWTLITERIKYSEFDDFDNWILKPDAHILQDQESSDFFKSYCSLESNQRELLFKSIRDESEDFYKDLIKYINVFFDSNNKEEHTETLRIYQDLFAVKWDTLIDKYKSLIFK